MTGLETFIIDIAENICLSLLSRGYNQITKDNSNEYNKELIKVISTSIELYEKESTIEETDRIPFYKSQILFDEFLKFRFTKSLNKAKIKEAIEADKRIIPPTEIQIKDFFGIFDSELLKSPKLKNLNIEINFKEEIFNISDFLKSINDEVAQSLKEIKEILGNKNISSELIEEWNSQLDEILEDVRNYKAFTAKERLEKLERRINEQSITSVKLFARLYYLKSECLNQISSADTQEEHAKLLIKAYKLQPTKIDFKIKAALGYHQLGVFEEAEKLSLEILKYDEFDIIGWIIRCYLANEHFGETLKSIPDAVKAKNLFKINLYFWLLAHRYIETVEDVRHLQLCLEIDFNSVPSFSYKNMKYQHLVASYLLGNFYSENPSITSELIYENAKESAEFKYAYEILKLSTHCLRNTEIEESYDYYQFQYYCCSFILNHDEESIALMEGVFKRMKLKPTDVSIRMMQAYNSLRNHDSYVKAIRIGEDYTGEFNDALFLFLAGNYGFIGEKQKETETFIKYIESKPVIDRSFFLNFISFVRVNKVFVTEHLEDVVKRTLSEKSYSKPEYQHLLKVFCFLNLKVGDYSTEEIDGLIENAKNNVNVNDVEISIHIAFAYCYNHQEERAKFYLREFVNTKEPSESLKLYCKVLFNGSGDKIELLEILKNWRDNFKVDYELLQIEFELRRLQNKWNEAGKVCKKALEYFPDSEFFLNALFISLNNDMQFNDIKTHFEVIQNKVFKDESVAVNVCKALLRAGLFAESLELLYKHAVIKENIQSRREFAVLFIRYPEDFFKQYEVVEIGTYVKYEINNAPSVINITETNKNDIPNSYFLNKRVGDTFNLPQKFSDILINVTIVQILNKYGALLQELFEEAKNPLSGHLIQSFKFKDESAESITETFVENFGVRGSLQKKRSEELLEEYYSGKISFAEITNSVFNRECVDAYFMLSNQKGKPFKSISPAISNPSLLSEKTRYVLDFTSLCLFYQLTVERSLTFFNKFFITHLIREKIVENLEDAKTNPKSNFSISITTERVIPHFYDEGFNDRRINTFQTILEWIDSNCILLDVPERLNVIMDANTKRAEFDLFMHVLIDCRLIVDKENHVLLTNDTFYYRHLKGSPSNIVSPLCFLEKNYLEKNEEYTDFMLRHNYVGIPVTSTMLNDQFYKLLSGEENWFSICLENLRYNWNPNNNHATEVIKFIKALYVSSLINNSTREQTTLATFQNLVVGMDKQLLQIILSLINKEFRLLDIQRINVLQLFALAIKTMQ